MNNPAERFQAHQALVRAKSRLRLPLLLLRIRLALRGYRLRDVYGALPGEVDWFTPGDKFLFEQTYTFQGAEIGDRPEARRRTLGYHWQLMEGSAYRKHIFMTVNRQGQAELRILYTGHVFPANRAGWKQVQAYLKSQDML